MSQIIRIPQLPITPKNLFYFYKATAGRTVDGDTIYIAEFDWGRKRYDREMSLRFCHYDGTYLDCWEVSRRPAGLTDAQWAEHRAKGLAAKAFTESLLPLGTPFILLTNKEQDGTFRDWAGSPFIQESETSYIDIPESLRANGHLKG